MGSNGYKERNRNKRQKGNKERNRIKKTKKRTEMTEKYMEYPMSSASAWRAWAAQAGKETTDSGKSENYRDPNKSENWITTCIFLWIPVDRDPSNNKISKFGYPIPALGIAARLLKKSDLGIRRTVRKRVRTFLNKWSLSTEKLGRRQLILLEFN